MKKRIYLAMLVACFALTATACSDRGAVVTDDTKAEKQAEGKKAEAGSTRLVSVDNVDKYITIGEYKGLILDNTVDAITDDDVQSQIDQELQDKAEPVSEGAKEGDLVTVNYTGTIDGQTFDGGTANNYDFVIGDGQMFTEFEDGVTGMKKGDTKEIQIDFPSDYGDSTLAGKTAVYKVTVQNVRRTAELTDEWVAKNTDYTTVDEYKEGVRSKLEADAKQSAQEVLKNTAWSTVLENSEVKEYPQEDIDGAVSEFKKSMELYAKQADMTLEEFISSQGISQDDFDEQCQQYAEGKVKQNLIVQGIMDAEGLSLDDKESLQLQEKLVKQMGAGNLAELVGTYGQDYVDESVGLLRVEDFIISNASVSDKISNGDTTAEDAEAAVQNSGQDAEDESADQDMSETDESIDQDASETDESDGEDVQDEPDVDEDLESELGTE
jgi:trigger factor